ncbi:hypothetical protein P3S68_003942 [Capsicum galapagoense]
MTSFLSLGLVDTKEDPTVELTNKELTRATSIKRAVRQGQPNVEALHDQPQTATDPGAFSEGVAGGVVCDGGSHPDAAAAVSRDYEHAGLLKTPLAQVLHLTSTPIPPAFTLEREDKLPENLETIVEAVEELKSRRGVIPSNEVRESCTPIVEVRRKRRKIRQILSVLKSVKIATPPAPRFVEVQRPPKKVNIFAVLGKEWKKEMEEFIKTKVKKEYTMHSFDAKDFTNMTNMRMWYKDNASLLLLT